MKTCGKCKKQKPLDEYYKNKNTKDGRQNRCKACNSEYNQKWYNEPSRKQQLAAKQKQDYADNPELFKERVNDYKRRNRDKIKAYKQRPEVKMRNRQAKRMRRVLGASDQSRTNKILGCSGAQLKAHLESQFTEGMTWDNYGFYGWHVDHIKPIASFDLDDPEQVKKCFHFTNLQPLWAADNLKKGSR